MHWRRDSKRSSGAGALTVRVAMPRRKRSQRQEDSAEQSAASSGESAAAASDELSKWVCLTCTWRNTEDAEHCAMCDFSRPVDGDDYNCDVCGVTCTACRYHKDDEDDIDLCPDCYENSAAEIFAGAVFVRIEQSEPSKKPSTKKHKKETPQRQRRATPKPKPKPKPKPATRKKRSRRQSMQEGDEAGEADEQPGAEGADAGAAAAAGPARRSPGGAMARKRRVSSGAAVLPESAGASSGPEISLVDDGEQDGDDASHDISRPAENKQASVLEYACAPAKHGALAAKDEDAEDPFMAEAIRLSMESAAAAAGTGTAEIASSEDESSSSRRYTGGGRAERASGASSAGLVEAIPVRNHLDEDRADDEDDDDDDDEDSGDDDGDEDYREKDYHGEDDDENENGQTTFYNSVQFWSNPKP